jgi:hypothetical protein
MTKRRDSENSSPYLLWGVLRVSHRTLPLAKGELEGVPHDPCQSGREPPSIPPPRGGKHEVFDALEAPPFALEWFGVA